MLIRTYGIVGVENTRVEMMFTSNEVQAIYEDHPDIDDAGVDRILKGIARRRCMDPKTGEVPNLFPIG